MPTIFHIAPSRRTNISISILFMRSIHPIRAIRAIRGPVPSLLSGTLCAAKSFGRLSTPYGISVKREALWRVGVLGKSPICEKIGDYAASLVCLRRVTCKMEQECIRP